MSLRELHRAVPPEDVSEKSAGKTGDTTDPRRLTGISVPYTAIEAYLGVRYADSAIARFCGESVSFHTRISAMDHGTGPPTLMVGDRNTDGPGERHASEPSIIAPHDAASFVTHIVKSDP